MKRADFNRMKTFVPLLLVIVGCIAITAGLLFYPEFLGKHIVKREVLSKHFITKAITFQISCLTLGFVMAMVGSYLMKRRYSKSIFITGFLIYCLAIYNVYISRSYPNNIFFDPPQNPKSGTGNTGNGNIFE